MISVIIPAYNEEKMIGKCKGVISSLFKEHSIIYELLFIDDGSTDSTWKEIVHNSSEDQSVRGIHFSRNFGKEAAIIAGLTLSKGDCCVVLDCDLQHPPEKIIEMYRLWEQGYDIIEGRKTSRGSESMSHSLGAKLFYSIISSATGLEMENSSDFKLLDRKAVDVLVNMKERNAFFRALSSWIGFKSCSVEYEVRDREIGESKWSTFSLVKYAIRNITSFSTAPLQVITALGVVVLIISLVLGCLSLIQKIAGNAVEGFTTVILILLLSSSAIMISLGLIGYYIAKIYEEIKERPRYIISEICGEN